MFEKLIQKQTRTGTALKKALVSSEAAVDSGTFPPGNSGQGRRKVNSEVLFNILTEKSFIGIYVAQDGRFEFVNTVFASYAGYKVHDLIGMKSDSLIHPEDRDRIKQTARSRLLDANPSAYEFRIVTRTGQTRWIMETLIPISCGGRPAILGNAIDITHRKLTEQKLNESENLYRTIFETTGTAMLIAEEDMTIGLINSEFERLSGYSKKEVEGKKKWSDFLARPSEAMETVFRRAEGDGSTRCEFLFQGRFDRAKDVFMIMSMIPGTSKRIASLLDMTELRMAEEAVLKRKKELQVKAQQLEELNATLKILLRRREEDKNELEEKVMTNIQKLVMPYLEKLKKSPLNSQSMVHVSALESNLKDVISPFIHKLSAQYLSLTPKELQIAYLIREGKSTKEIAEMMNVGPGAIDLHRNHLRSKLGIVKRKINLRSYLMSLEQ